MLYVHVSTVEPLILIRLMSLEIILTLLMIEEGSIITKTLSVALVRSLRTLVKAVLLRLLPR